MNKKFSDVLSQNQENNFRKETKDNLNNKNISEMSLLDESKSDLNSINLFSPNWNKKNNKRDFFNF